MVQSAAGHTPPRAEKDGGSWFGLALRVSVRAAINPRLALDLMHVLWAFRARSWYRKPPYLPLPSLEYMRWRMYTAYGDEAAIPPIDDVVRFARWKRQVMRV